MSDTESPDHDFSIEKIFQVKHKGHVVTLPSDLVVQDGEQHFLKIPWESPCSLQTRFPLHI